MNIYRDIFETLTNMKKILKIILMTFPLFGFCQTWNQLSNFLGEGRHTQLLLEMMNMVLLFQEVI